MPNHRNKSNRRQEEEAECRRRRAQSQRDKARYRREQEELVNRLADRITRAIQRPPTLPAKPSSLAVPVGSLLHGSQGLIMEARSKKLVLHIAQMFNDARYSDAQIVIHGVTLPVHKSVICIQSEYFEKAFQSGFVEGSQNTITFNEGSGAAYWRVFEYLYTGDYSDHLEKDFEDDPLLLRDPRVYVLADMFFLEELKALSTEKLRDRLSEQWASDSFLGCVREVYSFTTSSDRQMRPAVAQVARTYKNLLGQKAIFRELVREGGDFAVDFIFPEPLDVPDDPPKGNPEGDFSSIFGHRGN